MIKKYSHFVNELYEFSMKEDDDFYKSYEFTTKDNIDIVVKFFQLGLKSEKKFTREYYPVSPGHRKYDELATNDSFGILDTVTKITIQFIKDFSPNEIRIDHIPSKKERGNTDFINGYLNNKVITKRANINKRYLMRDLPDTYSYELEKSVSIITKL